MIKYLEFISIKGNNEQKVCSLKNMNIENDDFNNGVKEIEEILEYIKTFDINEKYVSFDLSIARGLDYYTGTVYETIFDDYKGIGSVCSGGRYDNLTSLYTKESFPGVGISIGLTRLFDQLKNNDLLKNSKFSLASKSVLILNMSDDFGYASKSCKIFER